MTHPLPEQWTTRDLPALIEIARNRKMDGRQLQPHIETTLGIDEDDVVDAIEALEDGDYLEATWINTMGGSILSAVKLRERGRRAVGIWPGGEGVDALVDALRQAEETTTDPEERTLIRRAAGALTSVSRDVMVDVMGAVIARQAGVG
ncbi:hypothetical protein ABKW28_11660 [Nocardioides sp. 31GB23]|uniref:hypothetical protein n=1 Tax=Nocardioides sp. 31GB23 TaxID=3156065 RepID=UPI0032AF538F